MRQNRHPAEKVQGWLEVGCWSLEYRPNLYTHPTPRKQRITGLSFCCFPHLTSVKIFDKC